MHQAHNTEVIKMAFQQPCNCIRHTKPFQQPCTGIRHTAALQQAAALHVHQAHKAAAKAFQQPCKCTRPTKQR